jgi:hypothetical protein
MMINNHRQPFSRTRLSGNTSLSVHPASGIPRTLLSVVTGLPGSLRAGQGKFLLSRVTANTRRTIFLTIPQ